MIRSFSLSLALLGLLFQTASAAAPQGDVCKVEQDHINTAIYVDGMMTQSFRVCSKGTISFIEVIASVDFAGGQVDIAIMDDTFTKRAMQTYTADNYNGTSIMLENLSIPVLQNDEFTIAVRATLGASFVVPGTDEPSNFVGGMRLDGSVLAKNAKFSAGVRSATPNLGGAQDGGDKADGSINDLPSNAMSRTAAGLDLRVQGDCSTAQSEANGVINVNGGTFTQTFYSCERGRILEAKVATPFVEEGYTFDYELLRINGDVITSGTFTSEDVTDGELHLVFDKNSIRKGQSVALKVTCPEGARIALLAIGVANADFGRLYVDGQSLPFNVAMAAGLKSATANDVPALRNAQDNLTLGAFPNPFADALNVKVTAELKEGALLQVLDHQGVALKTLSLPAGKLDSPVRFDDLGDLRPGIYSLRLLNGREATSLRILKN